MTNRSHTCLVICPHLAHYRYGVFLELDRSPGWEFTFAADSRSRNDSIRVLRAGDVKHFERLQNRWIARRCLWQRGAVRLALRGDFQSVIFTGDASYLSTWVSAVILRCRRIPVYFWTIGWHRPDRGLAKWARKSFYSLADKLMLYGQDGFELGVAMGYPSSKMHVIGNSYLGSDSDGGRCADSIRSFVPDEPTQIQWVGAVVRLNAEKRLDLLIESVAVLRGRGRQLGVLLVGAGPVESQLRAEASVLGVPLWLPGPLYSVASLRWIYDQLSVTVLPERAGLTVTQSLAYGTPVVTADDPYRQVPEFRAVVPGITGELYGEDEVDGLANAIERCLALLTAAPDEVAESCRREVRQNWSPESHSEAILRCLDAGLSRDGR